VLGLPACEVWSDLWSEIGPRIAVVLQEGQATQDEALLVMVDRGDHREETDHTFSYSPLHDDDGEVRGVLCAVVEQTGRLISERRIGLLGTLASDTAGITTDDELLAGLERSLASDTRDLPFTLLYLFDASGTTARLASQTGFPDHAAGTGATIDPAGRAVPTPRDLASPIDLASSPWRLGELFATGRSVEVALGDAAWPTGPWTTSPMRAFVVPIAQHGQSRPAGAFIAGLNPHRRFDAAYRVFLTLLVDQVAAGLANARAYLVSDLEVLLQRAAVRAEADHHAQRLASVFEHAPVAIAILRGPHHVFEIAGGFRTLAAHDGPSALQAARAFQPQIAVVDLGLPVMDGFELARHLLARTEATATKLVALTGYGQPQDRARTAAAGFEAHLVKPVDIEQLRMVIEQLLPPSRR
jgi:CheY-like chemotaxis protein